MATIDDINKQRDAALALLQRKLDAADDMRNAGQTGLDDTIRSLRDQRDAVDAQAYAAGLNDEAMTDALDALKSARSYRMSRVSVPRPTRSSPRSRGSVDRRTTAVPDGAGAARRVLTRRWRENTHRRPLPARIGSFLEQMCDRNYVRTGQLSN